MWASDPTLFDGLRELQLVGELTEHKPFRLPSSLQVFRANPFDKMTAYEAIAMFTRKPEIFDPSTGRRIPEYNPPQLMALLGLYIKDDFIGMDVQVIEALPQSLRTLSLILHVETDDDGMMIVDMQKRFPFMTDLSIQAICTPSLFWSNEVDNVRFIHLPEKLKNLEYIANVFDPSEAPDCIEKLHLNCNRIIDKPFPRSLVCLHSAGCTPNFSYLPPGLLLFFPDEVYGEFSLADIPRNLRVLKLKTCVHDQPLKLHDLPSTLEKLTLAAPATKDLSGLPIGLSVLKLDMDHCAFVSNLPSALEKLTLNMVGEVTINVLPSGLRALKIKGAKDLSCKIKLPSGLKSLELGRNFEGYISPVPLGLEQLKINNFYYPHKLPVLPETLRILKLSPIAEILRHAKTDRSRKMKLKKLVTNIPASVTFPYHQGFPRSVWDSFHIVPQKQQATENRKSLKRKRVHK